MGSCLLFPIVQTSDKMKQLWIITLLYILCCKRLTTDCKSLVGKVDLSQIKDDNVNASPSLFQQENVQQPKAEKTSGKDATTSSTLNTEEIGLVHDGNEGFASGNSIKEELGDDLDFNEG